MKDYNKENIPLTKTLRKNMTPWERKLWYDFLRSYPGAFKGKKQLGITLRISIAQEQG